MLKKMGLSINGSRKVVINLSIMICISLPTSSFAGKEVKKQENPTVKAFAVEVVVLEQKSEESEVLEVPKLAEEAHIKKANEKAVIAKNIAAAAKSAKLERVAIAHNKGNHGGGYDEYGGQPSSGQNNGWGNGDQDAPGNSGPHNHAENYDGH